MLTRGATLKCCDIDVRIKFQFICNSFVSSACQTSLEPYIQGRHFSFFRGGGKTYVTLFHILGISPGGGKCPPK